MNSFLIPLVIAYLLDLLWGDPIGIPHPICAIGNLISVSEKAIRKVLPSSKKGEVVGGAILVIWVLLVTGGIAFLILYFAQRVNVYLRIAIESIMCWQCLAAKSLAEESTKVYSAIITGSVDESRKAVAMIVGRDTQSLTLTGVTKATVETVAENTTDAVIAPILFMAIGGGVLGFVYKAVNTMDSMVGYKSEKYINFGKVAARMDDVLNFIPARISAFLMIASAFILGYDGKNAFKIFRRDRYNHASPNSAQTESVCAGALGVQLAGDAWYFGKLYKKEFIGGNLRAIEADDIKKANKLMYLSEFLIMAVVVAIFFV